MRKYIYIGVLLFLGLLVCVLYNDSYISNKANNTKTSTKVDEDFTINLIKKSKNDSNYLISPYSIEMALNLLKEGANGNTLKEINKVVPDRKINDVSVKGRVNVANALFIKDKYRSKIKDEFKNNLVKEYNSDILYDKFKTPDVINNWVNKQTDGMIERLLDDIDPDFVFGLANALAIDVEWQSPFDCSLTRSEEFKKADGSKINVEMMHNTYKNKDFKYLESDDAKGIILPYVSYDKETGKIDYDKESNLEFVGILPNQDVNTYIDNLTSEKLNKLIDSAKGASASYEIRLSLPRFKYEYSVDNFKNLLINMGIKDAFDPNKADFTNAMAKKDMDDNLYVSTAKHKTFINLNEKGTKAAAVTYFGVDSATALPDEHEIVEIKFNKPFVYLIRDSKTKEVLFFGAVFEPNLWEKTTCSFIQ